MNTQTSSHTFDCHNKHAVTKINVRMVLLTQTIKSNEFQPNRIYSQFHILLTHSPLFCFYWYGLRNLWKGEKKGDKSRWLVSVKASLSQNNVWGLKSKEKMNQPNSVDLFSKPSMKGDALSSLGNNVVKIQQSCIKSSLQLSYNVGTEMGLNCRSFEFWTCFGLSVRTIANSDALLHDLHEWIKKLR